MKAFALLCVLVQIMSNEGAPQLIIPYYSYMTPDSPAVQNMILASKSFSVTVVIKPDVISNPDGNWTASVAALASSGISILGYTTMLYGARTVNDVLADIDSYNTWPNASKINGIYLDQASNEFSYVEDYKIIYQYVRSKFSCKSKTFLSTGTNVDPSFFHIDEKNRTADTVVIFDDDYKNWNTFVFAPFYSNLASSELCAIIYSCTKQDMVQVIETAAKNNIGFIYVTDRQMNNPFDSLPTYYDDLILYLATN